MSGIQLNWQIESDKVKAKKQQEDPILKRARRVGVVRLALFICVMLALIALTLWLVQRRVDQIDQQVQQALLNTVEAEVAALRIGDAQRFMDLQRSATDDWLLTQQTTFQDYQILKSETDIRLTGNVLNTEIDGTRARVEVEEIIDGVPYARLWFYWRYEDGWHHVPADLEFWGESRTLSRARFAIRYTAVDDALAQVMNTRFEQWLSYSCTILDCNNLPFITIDIGNRIPEIAWVESENWQLVVPSPYIDQARTDLPFDAEMQIEIATLLATRLVNQNLADVQIVYPSDAVFLRSSVIAWLVGQYVQLDANSRLITSLSRNYGDAAVGQLIQSLQPTSNMSILSDVTGVTSLDQANLDWRDFITWRLITENDLIQRRDEGLWVTFYDNRIEANRQAAYTRFNAGEILQNPVVVLTDIVSNGDVSQPASLQATVQIGDSQQTILFELVNNVWLRSG